MAGGRKEKGREKERRGEERKKGKKRREEGDFVGDDDSVEVVEVEGGDWTGAAMGLAGVTTSAEDQEVPDDEFGAKDFRGQMELRTDHAARQGQINK